MRKIKQNMVFIFRKLKTYQVVSLSYTLLVTQSKNLIGF